MIMKHWYILVNNYEHKCEFISVDISCNRLYLRYEGITVRLRIHDFSDYKKAVNSELVDVIAISKKENKPVKVIFK